MYTASKILKIIAEIDNKGTIKKETINLLLTYHPYSKTNAFAPRENRGFI